MTHVTLLWLSIRFTHAYKRWINTGDPQHNSESKHTVYPNKYAHGFCFAVLCCGYTLIFPYPSGLLHWHCGNLTITPVPAKQPWWIWINISCGFIMNDCITTTKQSTTKPCAYFLGYTVFKKMRSRKYWKLELGVSVGASQWASCQIRKIAGAHAPGMPGTFSLSPHVSDPDMHHGTCVTHVPWCMPGSLTSGFLWNRQQGKTFPAFPAHAQPAILHIW